MIKTAIKILALSTLLTACSHTLSLSVRAAERATGTIVGIQPIYSTRYENVPELVCNNVHVPLINNANVLQGAIIGGIIGNSLRGGSKVRNRNTGAIIGAFIGANQSSGNNSTRVENRCHTVNRRNAYQVVEQYWLDIRVHGTTIRRSIYANNNRPNVRIGQQIDVMVNYSVN